MATKDIIYYGILVFLICVVLGAGLRGHRRGLVQLFDEALSTVAAVAVLVLIARSAGAWQTGNVSRAVLGVFLIFLLGVLYRLFHGLFGAVHLLARLPILHSLNKLLGFFVGLAEGGALVYALATVVNLFFLQ